RFLAYAVRNGNLVVCDYMAANCGDATAATLANPAIWRLVAENIASLRAQYQAWCEALAWLAIDLRSRGILDRVTITAVLPDPEPWVTAGESRRAG
ncbi:MAG: hypothetical protein JNK34_07025, partial [Tabrizicola sp.]|nr:hypothetical protein [Tabrizicola sp.]